MSNGRVSLYSSPCHSSPVGSAIRDRFAKRVENGKVVLVKVGETDQQALINSYKDECDVNRIVERYANGDSSVLARVQGLYSDISGFADNPTDLLNAPVKAREALEMLGNKESAPDAPEASDAPVEAPAAKSDVKEDSVNG